MEALFFTFAKRKNSLKVPVDSTGTSFNVVLKEPTSMDAPHLILNADTFGFNYAKFNGQYFFVSDITSRRNNLWEVSLEKDVLATYRARILAQSAFVMYDETANTELSDHRLSIKTSMTVQHRTGKFTTMSTATSYTAIVGITGSRKSGSDSTGLFAMSISDLYKVLRAVYSWSSDDDQFPDADGSLFTTPAEAIKQLAQPIIEFFRQMVSSGSAPDNIRSCNLLPIPLSSFDGIVQRVCLGLYDTGIDALRIDPDTFTDTCKVAIPWQASDWRRNAPYHEIFLTVPFLGTIPISPSDVIGETELTLYALIDPSDGRVSLRVFSDAGLNHCIGVYSANVGAQYIIGSTGISGYQLLNTALASVGGAASALVTGNPAIIAGAIPAINNNIKPQNANIGNFGGLASLGLVRENVICTTIFHDTNVPPASVAPAIGTPAMAYKALNTLSGYVQCNAFSLDAAAESGDLDAVNSYMNSGVFIE